MMRVVVIGVGLEGLIVSWVFRQHPHIEVWTIGRAPVGGHIEPRESIPHPMHSTSLAALLRELRVPASSFFPKNGILLRDKIHDYPHALKVMVPSERNRVFHDLRLKARLEPKKPNGELKQRTDRRLRLDVPDLTAALMRGSANRIVTIDDWALEPGALYFGKKQKIAYDFAVLTESLSFARSRVWFQVPDARAHARHTALVVPRNTRRYAPWDAVLTPYTPGMAIHQIAMSGHGFEATINGELHETRMLSDLNFLFADGYDLRSVHSNDGGTLQQLPRSVRWPDHVAALGAHAEWREGATLDQVVDGAYDLMRRWLR